MNQENRLRVMIVDSRRGGYLSEPDIERAALVGCADVELCCVDAADELFGRIDDIDAIISWHHIALQRDLLIKLRRCRGIVRASVGYDNIDQIGRAHV